MEFLLKELAGLVAIVCETMAVIVLLIAACAAAFRLIWYWRRFNERAHKGKVWLHFAGSIVLALEFTLAADIADTLIAPGWYELGHLAAIAAIRTFLNLFLERDIEAFERSREATPEA